MQDRNAKAPKSRKQEISPLLGSIVKITSLVVIAALVVLITVIVVKFIQNRHDNKIFEDRIEIGLSDFKIITNMNDDTDFADIQDSDIRNILNDLVANDSSHESTNYYFFFYYNDQVEDLQKEKDFVENINKLDKDFPLFIVKLDRNTEETSDPFTNYLPEISERFNSDYPFENIIGKEKWFTLVYNYQGVDNDSSETPFRAHKENGSKNLINDLIK